MYKGDFGRTIPVSGHFDAGQRETMELLSGAYLAGVAAMRPGATPHEVFDATAAYIAGHQAALTTPLAREAAAAAVAHPGSWSIMHGLGLDMAGGQGFFVEDTWVITATGHERVNPSIPYAPTDIERAMKHSHG